MYYIVFNNIKIVFNNIKINNIQNLIKIDRLSSIISHKFSETHKISSHFLPFKFQTTTWLVQAKCPQQKNTLSKNKKNSKVKPSQYPSKTPTTLSLLFLSHPIIKSPPTEPQKFRFNHFPCLKWIKWVYSNSSFHHGHQNSFPSLYLPAYTLAGPHQ